MCGIVGIRRPAERLRVLRDALTEAQHRGPISGGMALVGVDTDLTFRSQDAPSIEFLRDVTMTVAPVLAFYHFRAPTIGDQTTLSEVQPIVTPEGIFGHNGILLEVPTGIDCPTDSGWLYEEILRVKQATQSTLRAIAIVMDRVQGQAACFLYDRAIRTTYLWRQMAPLYVSGTMFTSTPHPGAEPLSQGEIVIWDSHGVSSTGARFHVNSIYAGLT